MAQDAAPAQDGSTQGDAAQDGPGAASGTASGPTGILRGELAEELRELTDRPADQAPAANGSGSQDAAPQSGPGAAADGTEPPLISDRLGGVAVRAVSGVAKQIREDIAAFGQIFRGLGKLRDIDAGQGLEILGSLLVVVAATFLVSVVGRRLAIPLYHRLGAGADRHRAVRTAMIAGGAILLDLAIVGIAFVIGAVVLPVSVDPESDMAIYAYLFIVAFLLTGIINVVVRAVLSPATGRLRAVPMDDAPARSLTRWLSGLVILIAFSDILVHRILKDVSSEAAADAFLVTIYILALMVLTGLVLRYRRHPQRYFERLARESDGDATYSVLAWILGYWHIAVLIFIAVLFHQAVTTGRGALPMLFAGVEVAAAFALAALLITLLTRFSDSGIHLGPDINRSLPTIEPRINAFIPVFVRVVRVLVVLLWVAYALQVAGIAQLWVWVERDIGVDIVSATVSVLIVVVLAFIAWLIVVSWIDYRMTPHFGHLPTARERTLLTLFRNAATVAILMLALSYILSELGVSVAPLLASAGVLGLAIGFGSQKMVEDIINGAFIQFENAINVGDFVEAGGKAGVVEKLTIRSVSLRDLHGVYHVVPFSSVAAISNHMKGFSYHVADIAIAYRADLDQVRTEMLAAFDDLRADPDMGSRIYDELEWFGVNEISDTSVVLRARLKTAPGEQWAIGRAYNEMVKRRIDVAGIETPYPRLTLWFADEAGGKQKTRGRAGSDRLDRANRIRRNSPTDADADAGGDGGDGPDGGR